MPPTPPQVAPTHTLTITASASCTALPAAAMKRTYPVQVQEKSDGNVIVLVVDSYDIMIGWATEPGFTGKRDGNSVRFDLTDEIFEGYGMVERIPGVGDVGFEGTATGTIDDNTIVATFNGTYTRAYGADPPLCYAPDHR